VGCMGLCIMYLARDVREERVHAQKALSLSRFAQRVPGRAFASSQDPPSRRECVINLPVCPERGGSSFLSLTG